MAFKHPEIQKFYETITKVEIIQGSKEKTWRFFINDPERNIVNKSLSVPVSKMNTFNSFNKVYFARFDINAQKMSPPVWSLFIDKVDLYKTGKLVEDENEMWSYVIKA
jgi:hypothetical protein